MYGKASSNVRLSMNVLKIASSYPRGLHGLGDSAIVMANGSRVSGPSTGIRRPAPRPQYPISQARTGYPTNWQGSAPSNGLNLAQLQQLLQTNPASLSASQWSSLQQAGTVPSTLPYSSASQLPALASPVSAADSTAVVSATDPTAALSTIYGGLPLYVWVLSGLGIYLFTRKR
ncbi:MAG: hypothetical protein ACRD20_02250 [Terriglobales bacterium]